MLKTDKKSEVMVDVCNFEEFFAAKALYPVGIDTYQRPYVWDKSKVQELLKDLSDYLMDKSSVPYYMGSILLHQNDKKQRLFIIDGQQRLTTLSILYFVLNDRLIDEEKMTMQYDSPISIQNIKKVQEYLDEVKDEWKDCSSFLFSHIQCTFITTFSEDLAFTFFDTQNNRGLKLNSTDLLKAFHLRAIKSEELQVRCADNWERVQGYDKVMGQQKDFTAELFQLFLWRARSWRGQRMIKLGDDDDVLTEFMKNTIESNDDVSVPLYPNFNNAFGQSLHSKGEKEYKLKLVNKEMSKKAYYPFTIRQPISKGLGFFLFSEKYADLLHLLFFEKVSDREILAFRDFYHQVWKSTSIYLKELFLLSTSMYFDQFRSKKLFEFALWLDHVLGDIRMQKDYVFKVAPLKFLKESENNMLDIISHAFRPEEVINFLTDCSKGITGYQKEVEIGKGVQGRYKQRVLTYYGKKDFAHKESWINHIFIEGKIK
jgi:hypothetical protein